MIKNRLDFKLINIALIAVICFFIYQASGLWLSFIDKIIKIIFPLLCGFVIAYALHPILEQLQKYKISKGIGVGMLVLVVLSVIVIAFFSIVPLLSTQIVSLVDSLIVFVKNLSNNFNIDFGVIEDTLINSFNQIIANVGKYVSDGAVKTINASINVVTNLVIAFASGIYFLLDMDKIRLSIKEYLEDKSEMLYRYIKTLDEEIKKYIKGFLLIVFISFFEYTIIYYIIGHPNALLLGFLSALANFIPYFGGIMIQIVGLATGFVISPNLGLKVLIITFISGLFDSYVLNPFVYGKSNQVHPIVVITAVFAGGILFGFIGIIIALPLSILVLTSYKFYNENNIRRIRKNVKRDK